MAKGKRATEGHNNGYRIFHGAASRIGESHITFPIGYQDAQFCISQNGIFIGVICDGCSLATDGYTQNQVGAILGSELIARNILKYAEGYGTRGVTVKSILHKANKDSLLFFKNLLGSLKALQIRINSKKFVEEKFLFTVIGLLIIKDSWWFFGCGDGLFGINDCIYDVERDWPSPQYLHPLLKSNGATPFTIYLRGRIKDKDTLWIASDGLLDLFHKEDGLQNFSEFLNDERSGRIFENNDQTIQPFRTLAQKYRNSLRDDLTVVISKVERWSTCDAS